LVARICTRWLAATVLLTTLIGCTSLPNIRSVQTAAGRHDVAKAGTGTPPVIFEAGAGDGLDTWKQVFPEIAKQTTAFAYSRRGYGVGTPVLTHRDGATIVAELRALLAREGLQPPYILVGHSLGGLYMQLFAKLYPAEVAGVVLVDSTSPDQLARMKDERPGNYALMQSLITLNALHTMSAEVRGMTETSLQYHAAGPPPQCPMIMLSAKRGTAIDGAGFVEFIQRLQAEVVGAWPGAEQRFIDSRHYIQREQPEAVITAIRELLVRAQNTTPTK
jgi:pimeloyl-ACP methyl ester carboxylesterase